MDKVYILIDSDGEPSKAFSSMEAAKAYCQGQVPENLRWHENAPSDDLPIQWQDYPSWSYGFVLPDPTHQAGRIEWSILTMEVHGQEKND